MNCASCYHYSACRDVDITGYVVDQEKAPDEACEHFIAHEDVHPTAHWVRRIRRHAYIDNVVVYYECSRCGAENEKVYTKDIMPVRLWDEYQSEHWMPKNSMYSFCHGCGAKMDLDKTDHTNIIING